MEKNTQQPAAFPAKEWFKSTRSGTSGCIEVNIALGSEIGIRDSKDLHGPELRVNRPDFQEFVRFVVAEATES